MAEPIKPNRKYTHLYAIVRYETDADASTPVDLRVTVKKVVNDPQFAAAEVRRLNEMNQGKGAYYFCQITRFEEVSVETPELAGLPPVHPEARPA